MGADNPPSARGEWPAILQSMPETRTAPTLTELIGVAADSADADDRAALYARAYPELRKMAQTWLFRHGGNTHLQATEILNEGYLRFVQMGELQAQNRPTFFALAANIIRSVIFDAVRRAHADKRGADLLTSLNTEIADEIGSENADFLALEQALKQLEQFDPRLAQVVDMHYFADLTMQEIADVFGVNEKTVRRDWKKAQILLKSMLA